MSQDRFNELMGVIARSARGKPLSADLAGQLNTAFGPDTPEFAELKSLCAEGEREGWLMAREAGGRSRPGASPAISVSMLCG